MCPRFAGTPHFKYALGILAIAFLITAYFSYSTWQSGQWLEVGKQPLDPMHASLQAYLLNSTGPHDIILSNNELSFSINAISGRKLVVSRRSHNSPFMDFDERELAAAEIFYGNDPQRRASLLSQYNVSYVFFSQPWYSLEFSFDSEGRVTDYSDPLMVFSSREAEAELDRYGVKYSSVRGYVDPALRGLEYRRYQLDIISPANYDFSGFGPWKDELDSRLVPVWNNTYGGAYSALYKVK